jgi:hypothetical protein
LENSRAVQFGARSVSNDENFNGKIFDVRIYKYAVTPAEAAWLYNRGGPIGWWKFDENTGSTANDAGGKGNNGTTTGATYVSGKRNYALDFDGSNDFTDMNDVAILDFNDKDFAISGWFNRDTFTTDDTIVAKRNAVDTGQGYVVYIDDSTDKLTFEAGDGTDDYQIESTSTFLATGWNHFLVNWDDDSVTGTKMYINGVEQNVTRTGTLANVGDLTNAVDFRIGGESDTATDSPFDGKLDEIQVFNYSLTRQQALNLYNSGAVYFGPNEGTP